MRLVWLPMVACVVAGYSSGDDGTTSPHPPTYANRQEVEIQGPPSPKAAYCARRKREVQEPSDLKAAYCARRKRNVHESPKIKPAYCARRKRNVHESPKIKPAYCARRKREVKEPSSPKPARYGGRRKRKIPETCVSSIRCHGGGGAIGRKRSVAEERALDERHRDVEAALAKVKTSLTIDLAKAARKELDALAAFENHSRLFDEDVIRNAIRRYEQCWLPLKPKAGTRPPHDVNLVWHAHKLRPFEYRKDSLVIAGDVVDHSYLAQDFGELRIREAWRARCAHEPYDLDLSRKILPTPYKQNSTYDLVAAVKRQRKFGKKILGLELDEEEIKAGVEDYHKFLAVLAAYPEKDHAPTMQIDLVWHAHQLHPLAYAHDTEAITGDIVDHVDEIAEGEGEELLPANEWREHFGEALLPIPRRGDAVEEDDE